MTPSRLAPSALMAACIALSASCVLAETFAVKLANATLGTLRYTSSSSGTDLNATLSNTPLGVFNGTFQGSSRPAGEGQEFIGVSKSSRKSREVRVQIAAGQALSTVVLPKAEETALSDPTKAPANVMDPVQAIGALLNAKDCPKTINIYDGRRAIALMPNGSERKDGLLSCKIAYKVTAGPGHLSPLRISNAKMRVSYVVEGSSQTLRQIRIGSGPFNLILDRRE